MPTKNFIMSAFAVLILANFFCSAAVGFFAFVTAVENEAATIDDDEAEPRCRRLGKHGADLGVGLVRNLLLAQRMHAKNLRRPSSCLFVLLLGKEPSVSSEGL